MSLGSVLSLLGRIAQAAFDLEVPIGQIARRVKGLVRRAPATDDTQPSPLTFKDVQHIQEQIRSATEKRTEIPPPPPTQRSRYE